MCPSYMATRNEEETTRGRANVLRLAMSGKLGEAPVASEEVHRALDLCLECKACKTECPSNVDMARLKSEHLAHWREERGATLRDWVFAETPRLARLAAGPLAPLMNLGTRLGPITAFGNSKLGIAQERALPPFARRRFSRLSVSESENPKSHTVVLFSDCWTETMETHLGVWARALLEEFGYRVVVEGNACCQRTRISKGFLKEAKRDGEKTIRSLDRFARKGVPILGIEPSCASSLYDDLPDLVENREAALRVAKATQPIQDFIANELERERIDAMEASGDGAASILLHGHCHQKALTTTRASKNVLSAAGAEVNEVDSGCCGMAGSFGYETEHFDISQTIGESRLFPAVRSVSDDTLVVADGFSCRHQIADATGRTAYHFVEALGRLTFGCESPPEQ